MEHRVPVTSNREVAALRIMQAGAIICVFAAATYKLYELDRFFVAKELVLHLTAFTAALLALQVFRTTARDRIDVILIAFLALSTASFLFATNRWLGLRALCISASGIALFWVARTIRDREMSKPLLSAIAFAVIAAGATSLLQAFGVQSDFFSINRAPGGTLGNRNFVAHLSAFGLPIVLIGALLARNTGAYFVRAIGATTVLAVLVLTRSRAGWLALVAVVFVFLVCILLSRHLRGSGLIWRRIAGLALLAAAGAAAAVYSPNKLRWKGDNPYLDSVRGVANYQEGSGAGRLTQYRRSLRMTAAHPLLGVGPGNWPVRYPEYAARRDPSMDSKEPGTTSNPWPSSDWIAFAAERGALAALLLLLAFVVMTGRAFRMLFNSDDATSALHATAFLATIAATLVTGAFDAVLLLGLPTLLVWTILGVLLPPPASSTEMRTSRALPLALAALLAAIGTVRSSAQLISMGIVSTQESTRAVRTATLIDPGNYRAQLRLGRRGSGLKRETRCRHARAARELFPNAEAARAAVSGCKR